MRKDSLPSANTPLFEALMRNSKLPSLSDDQEGILYQTVLSLGKRHQHNLEARRKANDAAEQAFREREKLQECYEQANIQREKSLEEKRKLQKKELSTLIKREQTHAHEVQLNHRTFEKQERQKALHEHSLLMSRMESCDALKQSRTLHHRSGSNSLEKSRSIKKKKQELEQEFVQSVLNESMEKEESAQRRLLVMDQTRKAGRGKLDEQLCEIHKRLQASSQVNRQTAAEKYIRSLHGSEVRLKQLLKVRNCQLELKAKRELDRHQKASKNSKAKAQQHHQSKALDLEKDNSRILRASNRREQWLDGHMLRHKQMREHESRVLQASEKENSQYLSNKISLVEATKSKQSRLSSLREELQLQRQLNMTDHFLNREISSSKRA